MTAITIVRGVDAIAIASDGAGYDDKGRLRQITGKVELFPHLSCAITGTGASIAPEAFREILFWRADRARYFDDVVDVAAEIAEDVMGTVERDAPPTMRAFTLFLCGYSEARARAETYAIRSRDWPDVPLADGTLGVAPALTLVPLPAIHCAPAPPIEIAAQFGIDVPGRSMTTMPADGALYAMKAVSACRFALGGPHQEAAAADPFCCVGGFLQLTLVARDYITSRIVHRWPDVIGDRMDIARGELHERAPLWLLEDSVQDGLAVAARSVHMEA